MRTVLRVLLCAAVLVPAWGLAQALPDLDLNRPHILLRSSEAPNLKFYARKDLRGTPAIEVNERGAFVAGVLVCSWPGGRYVQENESNMTLGYVPDAMSPSSPVGPCPAGFPVMSNWGDHGLGGAVQYIEVGSRQGSTIEVRFRGYLD
jgi:hypothetical protein